MVLNYSKWDALELSDDSDIEVHPNVDKRSFIRAKQNQIHHDRAKRRHEIKTLKYERIVNDGLLSRIDALLTAFREHAAQAVGGNPDEFVMNAVMDTTLTGDDDKPPEPPEDVHYKTKQPKYSEMVASLLDQVKKDGGIEGEGEGGEWYPKYIAGITAHKNKVEELQQSLLEKLAELEMEEGSKITSDSIHTGFSTSSISKAAASAPVVEEKKEKKKVKTKKVKGAVETVEVLNPAAAKRAELQRIDSGGQTSGADADVEDTVPDEDDEDDGEDEDDDEAFEVTPLGREFSLIKSNDYRASLQFISQHPTLLAERETDGLLMEAFNAGLEGKKDYAKQCVHQGLLLQYCRSLGKDGVQLFFKRITTQGHNAQKVFNDDVQSTYQRIITRTAEIIKDRKESGEGIEGGVEQIQLHAVDPNTEILIQIPRSEPRSSTGGEAEAELPLSEEEVAARIAFESFPPGLQRAMESRSLDRINEVLGKMSVSEAEEVVEKMGDHGMLSMEQGVIDGTTEEGKERIKRLEEEGKAKEEAGSV